MRINDYSIIAVCKKCGQGVFRCNNSKHSNITPTCKHIRKPEITITSNKRGK